MFSITQKPMEESDLRLTTIDLQTLYDARSEEVMSVLGFEVVPLVASPIEVLHMGRSGGLSCETLGGKEFEVEKLKSFARRFFREWKLKLQSAICSDITLYKDVRANAGDRGQVIAAAVVAALSHSIPELQPYEDVLCTVAVIVAQRGVEGFCKDLNNPGSSLLKQDE
jgi:hypothetical protein